MQVNETLAEGLKRELKVTIPASELGSPPVGPARPAEDRASASRVFGPAKCRSATSAASTARRRWRRSSRALVGETTRQAISERGERAAMQPKVAMTEDEAEATEVLEGRADLTFTLEYEVLPTFELGDFKGLKIERPVAEVADEEVEERLKQIAESARSYTRSSASAQNGDRVTFDYVGEDRRRSRSKASSTDGRASAPVSSFPGFEEQLVGVKAGDAEDDRGDVPGGLSGAQSRRQAGDLRRHDQGSGRAGRDRRSTTSSPSGSASNRSTSCARRCGKQIESEYGRRDAPAREAADARPARRAALVPAAGKTSSSRSSRTSGAR